jgi:hypothetical protein
VLTMAANGPKIDHEQVRTKILEVLDVQEKIDELEAEHKRITDEINRHQSRLRNIKLELTRMIVGAGLLDWSVIDDLHPPRPKSLPAD